MAYCEKTSYFNSKEHINYKEKGNDFCILETVKKIDQLQKAAVIQDQCEGCESSLCQTIFNTKPVIFYLKCCEPFTVEVPGTNQESHYFRIQELKGNCVKLRILTRAGASDNWDCTNFTVLLDLDCVCGIQCLPPICCEPCSIVCP